MSAPLWSTSCTDWERRILAGQSLVPFGPLFPDEAEKSLEVFRGLRLVDLPNSPRLGEVCRPWLVDFATAIFGAYDPESGRRLIREFMLLVSKKNSKSTTAAAIMMTALIRNWRRSNEFLILAPTIEIANNSFKPAADMVAADDALDALLHVQNHTRTITHRNTGATLKVVAANSETVGGTKAAGVLVDELWQFGSQANAENMLREATGGLRSRPEGFVVYLSTQSDDPPAGIFKKKLEYFRDVRDGKLSDPRSFGMLYEFPKAMLDSKAYLDPKNLWVTNPNFGASADKEDILDEFRKAERGGPESMAGFLAKHANVEIGLSLAGDRWAGADYWQDAADPTLSLDELLNRSEVAVIGIDGGGLDDLLGLAVIGRCKKTRDWLLWNHAWAQTDVFARRKEIVPRLRDFIKAGTLTLASFPTEDIRGVADICVRVRDSGKMPQENAIGLDPHGVAATVDELALRGFLGKQITGIGQGYRLTGAVWGLERKLKDRTLWHSGQDMMAWCVGNAKAEQKGNAVLITKQAAGKAKIDPLIAAFNAAMLMALNPEANPAPDYKVLFVGA